MPGVLPTDKAIEDSAHTSTAPQTHRILLTGTPMLPLAQQALRVPLMEAVSASFTFRHRRTYQETCAPPLPPSAQSQIALQTPISTGPYTVLLGGNTWYSGNVYLSLERIRASCQWSSRGVLVGDKHDGETLTMAPSEVFSQRARPITTGQFSASGFDFELYAYSFNFADLQSPYPWSAWDAQPDCVKDRCTQIAGDYNPWLAVPEAVRRLDERWASCDLDLYGLCKCGPFRNPSVS
jgi:hypothetical protein